MAKPGEAGYRFKTQDHPEANGRTASYGEQEYRLAFPLDEANALTIAMGRNGFRKLLVMVGYLISDEPDLEEELLHALDQAKSRER